MSNKGLMKALNFVILQNEIAAAAENPLESSVCPLANLN